MIRAAILFLALSLGGAALAQTTPEAAALTAANEIAAASQALKDAEDARDRVAALTDTVRAYEAGLAALRDGLRQAVQREAQLSQRLQSRETELARLVATLQIIGRGPPPAALLHPSGPSGTARAGMILAEITPSLDQSAQDLRSDLEEIAILRSLQEGAVESLETGLIEVQKARTALSQAVADRVDLPKRFDEDPVQVALLIASAETLEGFASGLSQIAPAEADGASPAQTISDRKGSLPLPVEAVVLRAAGEADAAGVRRPGLVLATRPKALVTAPTAATIRYRGPLLNYGQVAILEPQKDLMFVFAGMAAVFGNPGDIIPEGSPVGLMGGEDPDVGVLLSQSGEGTGNDRTETLYIEVREVDTSVDPETWFRTDKDN